MMKVGGGLQALRPKLGGLSQNDFISENFFWRKGAIFLGGGVSQLVYSNQFSDYRDL